jgi:hypothetical protein
MGDLGQRLRELVGAMRQELGAIRDRQQALSARVDVACTSIKAASEGQAAVSIIAAETISGHKVVAANGSGLAVLASPASALALSVIGVATGAAQMGAPCTILTTGEMQEPTWAFTPGQVWLGANGSLTQTPPSSGFIVCIGVATGPTRLILGPRLVAQL